MRKYEEQWAQVSEQCHQGSISRACKIAELKQLVGDYFAREDAVPLPPRRTASNSTSTFR
jgi:hypothetical protein